MRTLCALVLLCGCAAPQAGLVPADTPKREARPAVPAAGGAAPAEPPQPDVDIARSRQKGQAQGFHWEQWSKEAFARARAEHRFILLDGAAEWCHWCHVMDETTYIDPEVAALLRERFVAIRIDVDQRPDVASRYEDWGWPATVLFTPEAEEVGKFRGYLPPERMREILREVLQAGGEKQAPEAAQADRLTGLAAPLPALPWVAARVALDLDRQYDDELGGWGRRQKYPIGPNLEFELVRRAHGDSQAGARALFTLRQQRPLIDRVWGGMYQYSVGGGWDHPHFEKLMPVQAAALEAYAAAYRADPAGGADLLADARLIARYLMERLSNKEGAFLVSQDADVNAHDRRAAFVDGHVFYAQDDAGRRRLGTPRIDEHVYARENGLAIAALAALHRAAGEKDALRRARQAADLLLRSHVDPDGTVRREAAPAKVFYLADAAALGRGLAVLAEVTGEPRYRQAAGLVAQAMVRRFGEEAGGGALWVSTLDPAAAGVFARRGRPFAANVTAARLLLAVSRLTGQRAQRDKALQILAALSTPKGLDDEGRMVGEFLLALDEAGVIPWDRAR